MDGISVSLVLKALDGLHLRFAYTAQNIANANSPDYHPVRVSFEDALAAAAPNGSRAIDNVSPRVFVEDPAAVAGPMRLDLELAQASQTAMRYRALLDLLGRQYAIVHASSSAGR